MAKAFNGLGWAQGEERADGIIQINRDYETVTGDKPDAVRWIMGHELFHTMKRISPEDARSFQDAIMQDEENQRRVDAVLEAYQRSGAEISRDEVMEEIAADLSGDIFNEESDFLERFIQRNRSNQNVLTRLWQAIKDFAARLTGKRKQRANEAMTLLENAMDETARRVKDLPGVDATGNVGVNARQSFAGRNARTANVQRLQDAKELEQNGRDNESIRQETGWHKGRDGKWRFEIDDSQMQYFPDGDARFRQAHPEYAEYQELYQKLFDGTLTDAEQTRLEKLDDLWGNELGRLSGRVERGEATLDDILQHDALFEAYPELRNVRIEYQDMDDGVSGTYYPKSNKIVLNSDDLAEAQKSALLHEIQHAIQHIEGFSPGTSTKAYERKRKELEDAVRDVEHNRDLWLKDAGVPDFVRESMEQVRHGKRTIQEHFAALERFKQESKYAEEIAASEEDVRRARERLGEYGTPYDRYKRTAGEIEARDTQARRELTAEGRKNTAPDLGGEDTVFAEGDVSYLMSSSEGNSIKDQLRHHQDELNKMDPVAHITGLYYDSSKPGAVRKAIVEHMRSTGGFEVDVPVLGKVVLDEKRINTSLNYLENDSDAAAYKAIKPVLRRGKVIYNNTNHKDRGYGTITIAAPITINGALGNMAVVVKQTGKNYYKMHRVLTPDGKTLDLEQKADAEPTPDGGITQGAYSRGVVAPSINSASNPSIPSPTQESNTKMSIPTDKAYMDAVNRGDTEAAQQMVDEAAGNAGYNIEGYHGTDSQFSEFKYGDIGYHIGTKDQAEDRIRQTRGARAQEGQKPKLMKLYARINNPLYTAFDFGDWHARNLAYMLIETEQFDTDEFDNAEEINARLDEIGRMAEGPYADKTLREFLQSLGYDGIQYENQFEAADPGWDNDLSYIAFSSDQLKYADPVTYDDNGEVIPLSQRFQTEDPDIRYSIKSPGVTGQDAAALARENRELREKLEHWKAQVKRTDRRDVDPKSLRQLARRLRKDYSTDMDADAIAGRLGEIYNGITHDMEYGAARDLAQRLAGDMIGPANFLAAEIMESFWEDTELHQPHGLPGALQKALGGRRKVLQAGD